MSLETSSEIIINICMHVKKGEKVLVLYDKNKKKIAKHIAEAAKKVTENTKLFEMPTMQRNGQEPPTKVAKKMLGFDVVIMTTTKSLSHTNARKNASKKGTRIASMPGITEEIMERTMLADYEKIKKLTNRLADRIDKASKVRVITDKGTDISMDIKGKKCHGRSGGIFIKKGEWGNLPEGEACLAPNEGTTNGVFVVDASILNSKVKKPLKVIVKGGYAVSFEGEQSDIKRLKGILEPLGRDAFNIAELGVGTNPKAKITGNVLEDEKVFGTAHIALGNNTAFEGKVDVPVHVDGVFTKPTIFLDKKKIIEKGVFLF